MYSLEGSPICSFCSGSAVTNNFVLPARGGHGDISSNSQGSPCATSVDSPSRPADKPDRRRSSAGDNRSGVGSGRQADCTPVVADGKEKAEKLAASSGKSGPSSGGSRRGWKGLILCA